MNDLYQEILIKKKSGPLDGLKKAGMIGLTVLALFADSPTHIRGIGHIRGQECDRLTATITEINRLGGDARVDEDGTGLIITPVPLHGARIETYDDHRMAMAFALTGLRVDGVEIVNPSCCKKTFENYFELFTECFC